jgi:sugar/nucleoside kinase (ribokinase family)
MRLSCAGNALIDIIAFVETDFPSSIGLHGGSTAHVSAADLEPVLAQLQGASYGAGGGAANTARVFASLGYPSSFAGSIGHDEYGRHYIADMRQAGVESHLQVNPGHTGVFCALIEPAGERTIVVGPGVAAQLDAERVPASFFNPSSTLYLDGFLASSPDTLTALVRRAKAAGMAVAFDVAGSRIAVRNRELFLSLIRESCSWTFMNEDEFIALADTSVDDGLASFSADVPGVVIVKRAEIGAVCVSDGLIIESAVRPIQATDTTGAGDAFAAGFMAAALSGSSLARCLRLGNRVAEHAIQVPGIAMDASVLRRAAAAVL